METKSSFYSEEELKGIGFKSYGSNLKISRYARFYSPQNISIGDNVRIDDFSILSGKITLGSHIHISAYVALFGALGIEFEDYSGISPRSTIYSAMDDFGGEFLIGPIHSENYTNVTGGKVTVKRYCQIGCNCVVFPNLTINEGAVIGAFSLVKNNIPSWTINVGVPAAVLRQRSKKLLDLFIV